AGHPSAADRALEDLAGVAQTEGDCLRPDILEPDRYATVCEELRDPTAHHAGAEDAHAFHRPRLDGRRRLLRPLHEEEDVDQILADLRDDEAADGPGLEGEGLVEREREGPGQHVESGERGGVVPLRFPEHLLAGLPEKEAATRRRVLQQASAQTPTRFRPARTAVDPLPREASGSLVQDRSRDDLVHEADPERALRVDRLPRHDHLDRRPQPDQPGKARGPAPAGDDPEADLREPDLRLRTVAGDPVRARESELGAAAEAD